MHYNDVLENGVAGNSTPVPACTRVCASMHQAGEDRDRACRAAACGVRRSRRGSGVGPLPSVPPSRKPACTSEGFHMKQHRVGLFYRAPTPDHTQGTADSHRNPGLPGEGSADSRPFLGEACGFCKGFPACVGPILFSSCIKRPIGYHTLPWSFVDPHENSTQG